MGDTFKKAERDTLGAVSILVDLFGGGDEDFTEAANYVRSKIGNIPESPPSPGAAPNRPPANPGQPSGGDGGAIDLSYCARCSLHYYPGGPPHQCTPSDVPRPPPTNNANVPTANPVPARVSGAQVFFCSHCGKRNKVDTDE